MSENLPQSIRAYMSAIGSKKTEAKSRSSRANAAKGAAARRKDPATLPCTCGGCPENPKTTCPRGRLLRQRARLLPSKNRMPSYTRSLVRGGEMTAFTAVQEDIHEYSHEELAAMEAGAFERPQG